jgi:hypothetical protein
MRCPRWLVVAVCWPALGLAAGAAVPSQRELHSAECVAALEINTDDLARQVKAGRVDLRPLLRQRLDAGAAFIGAAYLAGDRDEARAQALLAAALKSQAALPKAEQAASQARCAQEGARLLAASNFISRAVVSRLAKQRMKRLLGE